jgi:hypothetical protein
MRADTFRVSQRIRQDGALWGSFFLGAPFVHMGDAIRMNGAVTGGLAQLTEEHKGLWQVES